MRLAVVSPFLDRQHGTELCIIEQIERLALKDHWNIELYSQRVSQLGGVHQGPRPSTDSVDSIVWHKIPEIPGPHLIKYLWWFFANQWRRRSDRLNGKVCPDLVYSPGINCLDADVIVVHIVFHAFYERVRPELALSRAPVRSWPRLIHRKLYYNLIMSLERKVYRNSRTRLIAVSRLVAAQLRSYFQRQDVFVVPNAIDTSRFTLEVRMARRVSSRESFRYTENDFVLLLIGNDWKKKGLDTLLRAVASLNELPLRILVVGKDDAVMFHPMLDQLGVRERVRFEKPSADVLSFYAAADVYVGPSLEDAFNLPILEAMACGLPVIASSQAGASELILDGETGLILQDPQDHLHLAHLIRRIFTDEASSRAMGETASRQVLANCSWDENTARTRQFLESSLAQRSGN